MPPRLVNARTLELQSFSGKNLPKYAILSHKWEDDEVTFEAIYSKKCQFLYGYSKLEGACNAALRHGFDWLWLDTCCIMKSSDAELREAINSMYRWYENAEVCLVYLHDFEFDNNWDDLRYCIWFTRGWTLQELIAPSEVIFFDKRWTPIGTKSSLRSRISQITGVDQSVLAGEDPRRFSVAQRFSWAARRRTTLPEDRAYCLLGLFNLSMETIYGEGDKAFLRLQDNIIKQSTDQSIFAWDRKFPGTRSGLFAPSPDCFVCCQDIIEAPLSRDARGIALKFEQTQTYLQKQMGLEISLITVPYAMNIYLAILRCCSSREMTVYYGIFVEKLATLGQYARVEVKGKSIIAIDLADLDKILQLQVRPLLVRQLPTDPPLRHNYGFWLRHLRLPEYRRSELDRAKIFSRDGCVLRNSRNRAVMKIPTGRYGTAGIVRLPQERSKFPWWQVEYLVFGFDHNFLPCCMLGNYKLGANNYRFVNRVVFGDEVQNSRDQFKNEWLQQGEQNLDREAFRKNSFCIVKAQNRQTTTLFVDFLSVSITFELVPSPPEIRCLDPDPWSVWAIDVKQADGISPQALAERDMMRKGANSVRDAIKTDLPKGLRQAILGSAGLGVLGDIFEGIDV